MRRRAPIPALLIVAEEYTAKHEAERDRTIQNLKAKGAYKKYEDYYGNMADQYANDVTRQKFMPLPSPAAGGTIGQNPNIPQKTNPQQVDVNATGTVTVNVVVFHALSRIIKETSEASTSTFSHWSLCPTEEPSITIPIPEAIHIFF